MNEVIVEELFKGIIEKAYSNENKMLFNLLNDYYFYSKLVILILCIIFLNLLNI